MLDGDSQEYKQSKLLGFAKNELLDYQGAIADYNKAIELNPTDLNCYYNRALVKEDVKDYQGAIIDYNKIIDLDDIHDFFIPDEYDLYFVDFFVYQHHFGFATNPKMHASFMNFLINSAKNGYFIRKIFAHTSSSYSIKLCRNAGFSYVTDHQEHRGGD